MRRNTEDRVSVTSLTKRLQKAIANNDWKEQTNIYTDLGELYHNRKKDPRNALTNYTKAIASAKRCGEFIQLLLSLRAVAEINAELQNENDAIRAADEFICEAEKMNKKEQIQLSYHVKAWVLEKIWAIKYDSRKDRIVYMKEAFKCAKKSLEYLQTNSKAIDSDKAGVIRGGSSAVREANLLRLIAGMCGILDREKEAVQFIKRALAYARAKRDTEFEWQCYHTQMDFPWADKVSCAMKLLQIARTSSQKVEAKLLLAESQLRLNENFDLARELFFQVLKEKNNFSAFENDLKTVYDNLIILYKHDYLVDKLEETSDRKERRELSEKIADELCEHSLFKTALDYYQIMMENSQTPEERAEALTSLMQTKKDLGHWRETLEYANQLLDIEESMKVPKKRLMTTKVIIYEVRTESSRISYEAAISQWEKELKPNLDVHQQVSALSCLVNYLRGKKEWKEDFVKYSEELIELDKKESEQAVSDDEDAEEDVNKKKTKDPIDFMSREELERIVDIQAKTWDVEEQLRKNKDKSSNSQGETRLHIAARDGDVTMVKKLIEMGYNVNKVDYGGWTALHETVFCDENESTNTARVECARLLLENRAIVDCVSKEGLEDDEGWSGGRITPLMDACQKGFLDMAEMLYYKYHASVTASNQDKWTAVNYLQHAIDYEDKDTGEVLISEKNKERARKLKEAMQEEQRQCGFVPPVQRVTTIVRSPRIKHRKVDGGDRDEKERAPVTPKFPGRFERLQREPNLFDGIKDDDDDMHQAQFYENDDDDVMNLSRRAPKRRSSLECEAVKFAKPRVTSDMEDENDEENHVPIVDKSRRKRRSEDLFQAVMGPGPMTSTQKSNAPSFPQFDVASRKRKRESEERERAAATKRRSESTRTTHQSRRPHQKRTTLLHYPMFTPSSSSRCSIPPQSSYSQESSSSGELQVTFDSRLTPPTRRLRRSIDSSDDDDETMNRTAPVSGYGFSSSSVSQRQSPLSISRNGPSPQAPPSSRAPPTSRAPPPQSSMRDELTVRIDFTNHDGTVFRKPKLIRCKKSDLVSSLSSKCENELHGRLHVWQQKGCEIEGDNFTLETLLAQPGATNLDMECVLSEMNLVEEYKRVSGLSVSTPAFDDVCTALSQVTVSGCLSMSRCSLRGPSLENFFTALATVESGVLQEADCRKMDFRKHHLLSILCKKIVNVRLLDLTACGMDNSRLKILTQEIYPTTSLTTLRLAYNTFSSGEMLGTVLSKFASLVTLDLTGINLNRDAEKTIDAICALPLLEHLYVGKCRWLTGQQLDQILQQCRSLVTVDASCTHLDTVEFELTGGCCLKSVSLAGCRLITSSTIDSLIEWIPMGVVEFIDLSSCPSVTWDHLESMMQQLRGRKKCKINLRGCKQLEDAEGLVRRLVPLCTGEEAVRFTFSPMMNEKIMQSTVHHSEFLY